MALLLASRISQAGLSYFLSCFVLLNISLCIHTGPLHICDEARRSDRNKCWMRAFAQGLIRACPLSIAAATSSRYWAPRSGVHVACTNC